MASSEEKVEEKVQIPDKKEMIDKLAKMIHDDSMWKKLKEVNGITSFEAIGW